MLMDEVFGNDALNAQNEICTPITVAHYRVPGTDQVWTFSTEPGLSIKDVYVGDELLELVDLANRTQGAV